MEAEAVEFDEIEHRYTHGGRPVPSVTQALQEGGVVDYSFCAEWARERGSAVHRACHRYDVGVYDAAKEDPRIVPYVDSWARWVEESKVEILLIEPRMASRLHGFGGTPDRVVLLVGALAIPDIKTGAPNDATGYQTAGYEILYNEANPDKIRRRLAVHLDPAGGRARVHEYKNRTDRQIFLAALTLCQMKRGLL